jgi:hypothetical protein
MNEDKLWRVAIAALALGVLGAAVALLLGVIQAGSQLLSSVVLITLQILLSLTAVAVSFALSWWLVGAAITGVTKRFAELEERYQEQFKRLRAKRPAWIATLLFITEAIMILVDKSFEGRERETLIVSFSLVIGFWVANQLMTCEERWKRLLGGALWFVVLLLFPVSVAIHRHLAFAQFLAFLWSFDLAAKVFFAVAFLSLITLPTLALRVGAETD